MRHRQIQQQSSQRMMKEDYSETQNYCVLVVRGCVLEISHRLPGIHTTLPWPYFTYRIDPKILPYSNIRQANMGQQTMSIHGPSSNYSSSHSDKSISIPPCADLQQCSRRVKLLLATSTLLCSSDREGMNEWMNGCENPGPKVAVRSVGKQNPASTARRRRKRCCKPVWGWRWWWRS